jgi:hypothetical protein
MEDMNIRNFKLINGDNIIALVSNNNRDNYLVERPVSVLSSLGGGYQFSPWFPFSEQNRYSIDKHNIIGDSSVMDVIKQEYIKYALARKEPIPPPESAESIMERITNTICNRFEIEDHELEELDDILLNPDKETIH